MKKILLILLAFSSFASFAQAEFPEGVQITGGQPTNTTPAFITTTAVNGTQEKIPSAYIEKTANKISTITGYSETLYPNEKATHDGLDLKLNISDLPTNLTLYPTTVASDVAGYVKMVTDIHDVDYNTVAVDVSTPLITTTNQLISQRISAAGVLIGQPGVFNITTFGNIRHLSGSGSASFYFEVYKRTIGGVESLICTSSNSLPVTNGGYSEFSASAVWDDGTFLATDRIVIKSYANRIAGGSDPVYQFQFGGVSPVRTILPVPFSVVDAGYEVKINKQNSLAVDGTGVKYPTVDAVNEGIQNLDYNYIYPTKTLINAGSVGSFDENMREIGNYFVDTDGRHILSYTGHSGSPGVNSRAIIAISTDGGNTFTKQGVAFNTPAEDPYIIKVGSTYYMYTEESTNNPKVIQVHTSTDLITWTFQNTCLPIDNLGNWDSESIGSPLPYYKDGVFYLMYEGINFTKIQLGAIGIATSTDGINFTKQPKPFIVGTDYYFPKTTEYTVDWAKVIIPDDIIFFNGKYNLSFHGTVTNFGASAGLVTSKNIDSEYIDPLGTWFSKKDNNISDIMFAEEGKNINVIYLNQDSGAKQIFKGVFSVNSNYLLGNKSLSSNAVLESSVLNVNSKLYLKGKANTNGLSKYATRDLASADGVGSKDAYINSFNEVTQMSNVYNLVSESDPTTTYPISSGFTAEPFAWGIDGIVNSFKNTSGAFTIILPTTGITVGKSYNVSFLIKMDDGSKPVVYANNTSPLVDVYLQMANLSNIAYTVELISGTTYRISATKVQSLANTIYITRTASQSGKGLRIGGFQVTSGSDLQPYTKTPQTELLENVGFVYFNGKEKTVATAITGNLTTNTIPIATGVNTLGNSLIKQVGGSVDISTTGGATPALVLKGTASSYQSVDFFGGTSITNSTKFQFGQYNTGQAFFFNVGNERISFFTNSLERMTILGNGNALFKTTVDNGQGVAQFNGNVTFSAGILQNQGVNKGQLDLKADIGSTVNITGNQTIAGVKTYQDVSGTSIVATNNTASLDGALIVRSTSTGVGLNVLSNGASSKGILLQAQSTDYGQKIITQSTGVGLIHDRDLLSTSDLVNYKNNGVLTSKINYLGELTSPKITMTGLITMKEYTVATLPTPTTTAYATVTDALAPSYMVTIVGGGTVVTPVFYNGTNWVAH